MKLTKGQQQDIDLCRYFYPCTPTDVEIEEYLALSERGEGKERGKFSKNPLVIGKTKRGLAMEMWEEGVLEGVIPYITLLGGYEGSRRWYNPIRWIKGQFYHKPIPRLVVDYMKKEMFKGIDANIIENCYQGLMGDK